MPRKKRNGNRKGRRNIGIVPLQILGDAVAENVSSTVQSEFQSGDILGGLKRLGEVSTQEKQLNLMMKGLVLGAARSSFGSIPIISGKKFTISVLGR